MQDVLPKQVQSVNRLIDKDYAEAVTKRGLNPEWILANCRTMERQEAAERIRSKKCPYGGIWLEGANGYGQFRPRKEFIPEGEKNARKYITAYGEEYDAMLPNNPHNPHYWDDIELLKAQAYNIDGHPCLVVTEGIFTAIAPCSNNIPTVALAGVEQGLTPSKNDVQGKRYLVPTLETLARAGFGWIIGFDADAAIKEGVVNAQRKLAQQLGKFNVPVYSITGLWSAEEGKGMDDFIGMNGFDKFEAEVLAKAQTIEQWEKQFNKEGNKEGKEKKLTQGSMAGQLAEKYRAQLAWNVPAKAWYHYEKRKGGVWSETPLETVKMFVIDELNAINAEYGDTFVNGVVSLLKSYLRIEQWEVIAGKVCLEDCVIDIHTLEATEHQPGYRFLSSLPFKWADREVGCEPIKQWLLSTCGDRADWVEVIRAAMNATITERGAELQRFMELVGVGGAGKGTILRLIQELLGKDNYTVTTLSALENNGFETATMFGKKAVFITDAKKFSEDISVIKSVVGGDPLRHEKKGVQMTGSFIFNGVLWVAANSPIKSSDSSNAMHRRRVSMQFNKCVAPSDRRPLMDEFKPYLPGLLAWVLSMHPDEVADYFRNTAKRVPSLGKVVTDVLLADHPLAEWADYNLYLNEGAETKVGNLSNDPKDCLYASYAQWAADNGKVRISTQNFSNDLVTLLTTQGIPSEKKKTKRGAHISNISLRQPGHDFPLLLSGEDLGEDLVRTEVRTETIGSYEGEDLKPKLGSKSLQNESVTQLTDSPPNKGLLSPLSPHPGSTSSPATDTAVSQVLTDEDSDLTKSSPVSTQYDVKVDSRQPQSASSYDVQPFREGQNVYPLTGKYQGKQCKVSAIVNNQVWAYPVTTQLGVAATAYQSSELSLTFPVAATTTEESEVYQPFIDWENEEYLDSLDD